MTVEAVKDKESKAEEASVATQLPEPQGYKILIALPEAEETTDGGIIIADQTRRIEETASIVGFVLKLGPDCYKDEKRFPNGPYCEEGDFVISEIKRVSKPGRRVYSTKDDLPDVLGGMGITIVSTSKGVMSDRNCRRDNVGGELICTVS